MVKGKQALLAKREKKKEKKKKKKERAVLKLGTW